MKIFYDYRSECISFFNGSVVLVYEILGARMVGTYIGNSLFTWTSIIAVILGALSLGYYFGGKLADRYPNIKIVTYIYLSASLIFLLLFFTKDIFLEFITSVILDVRYSSLIIAVVLFAPASFLLGLIPPIITKLHIYSLQKSGSVVGKFESIGTAGSIFGTLCAGFFLIPFFGVSYLLLVLGVCCLILSSMYFFRHLLGLKITVAILFIYAFFVQYGVNFIDAQNNFYSYDTQYSHITIAEGNNREGKLVKELYIDNITHAGMYVYSSDLVHEYTKYYHLFDVFSPNAKNVVMFGGAAYSFPKNFLLTYPDKNIDVVEIDPGITQIAKDHFGLTDNSRLHIYHQDARVFLNHANKKYDAILGDAFGNFYSVPYQLTTKEVAQKKYDMLTDDGVVIVNVIGAMQGKKSRFVQSEYKTYAEVFPEVFVIPVSTIYPYTAQNIMLVALKKPGNLGLNITSVYRQYLSKMTYLNISPDTVTLTDDFAPVDYYNLPLLN